MSFTASLLVLAACKILKCQSLRERRELLFPFALGPMGKRENHDCGPGYSRIASDL